MQRRKILNPYLLVIFTILFQPHSLFAKIIAGPYLQSPNRSGIIIKWISDDGKPGTIYYGLNLEKKIVVKNVQKIESLYCYVHEARITKLKPATKYFYKLESGDYKSSTFSFKTKPKSQTAVSFLAISDAQFMPDLALTVPAMHKLAKPDLIVFSGDLVNNPLWEDDWFGKERSFFDIFTGRTKGAPLFQNIPIYPSLGNHEFGEEDREGPYMDESLNLFNYLTIFSLPGNERYYSHDYGNTHFIHLNISRLWRLKPSKDPRWPLGDPIHKGSEQYRWLENDLKRNKSKWTVVSFHHPIFGMGNNSSPPYCIPEKDENGNYQYLKDILFDDLRPLLERYQVNLVMWGHNHIYEHYFYNGIHYVESSCIGNTYGLKKKEAHDLKPEYQNSKDRTFTFVEAGDNNMVVKVFRAKDEAIVETFEIKK